ncbi:hypothetical protein G9A89_022210 [Geosiphon pyriformis]|nr:hypothetical protein G9A89_022210 [Geosiphon pyriformis]
MYYNTTTTTATTTTSPLFNSSSSNNRRTRSNTETSITFSSPTHSVFLALQQQQKQSKRKFFKHLRKPPSFDTYLLRRSDSTSSISSCDSLSPPGSSSPSESFCSVDSSPDHSINCETNSRYYGYQGSFHSPNGFNTRATNNPRRDSFTMKFASISEGLGITFEHHDRCNTPDTDHSQMSDNFDTYDTSTAGENSEEEEEEEFFIVNSAITRPLFRRGHSMSSSF